MKDPDYLKDPADFSLVIGGPLYQLFLRSRLARPPFDLLKRRIVVITLMAWLPLLLLSAFDSRMAGIGVPFLHDIEAHVRFLVALPLLIAAELVVHRRIRPQVKQFIDRGIIIPDEIPSFNAAVGSAMRLRNSVALEIGLLVLVYTVGHWLWSEQIAIERTTWYAVHEDSGSRLTIAGYWYAFVSLPIFQFILLRWYLRLFIWFRFLWQVSRLNLRLIPTHPDRAGGLGFIGNSAYAFGPILFAQGAMVAGLIASRIFYGGQSLTAFKVDITVSVLFLVMCILAPLTVFMPHLARAKRKGLREYGQLGNRYVQEFDEKWVRGGAPAGEALIGSSDIQSLADFGNSYAFVRDMRQVPFGLEMVVRLAVTTVAPILPLTLTIVPLEAIVDRLIKTVL